MANSNGNRNCIATRYMVRLFVAGDAPNSRVARENLRRLRERVGECEFDIEIIDVLKNPQAALEHGVYVTPALQIIEPGPGTLVFGNLSDHETLQTLFPEQIQ